MVSRRPCTVRCRMFQRLGVERYAFLMAGPRTVCMVAKYYASGDEGPATCPECGGLLADGHMPECDREDDPNAFDPAAETYGTASDERTDADEQSVLSRLFGDKGWW